MTLERFDSFPLLLRLLTREDWREQPVLARADPDATDGVLVAAAAALAAGEPKRALTLLDADPPQPPHLAAVAGALRVAAVALDRNWFPGGTAAVLEDEPGRLPAAAVRPEATAEETLLVTVAVRLVAALPTWRSVATGSRRGFGPVDAVVTEALGVVTDVAQDSGALGAAALGLADVLARTGNVEAAGQPLQYAVMAYGSADDRIGSAACLLAKGDWAASPVQPADLLGEDLEWPDREAPAVADPAAAEDLYRQADAIYTATGAIRGTAAVAVRRARLRSAAGRPDDAKDLLARAGALATRAGDTALAMLATVHGALAALELGAEVPVDEIGAAVSGWANTVGSASYARGLARLCHAKARRWRRDDVLRGRRALMVADAINRGLGAELEASIIDRERAEVYVGANYRRAALLWTLLDLEHARAAGGPLAPMPWARLVDLVVRANNDAGALSDPDHLHRVAGHAEWLIGERPDGGAPGEPLSDGVRTLADTLQAIVTESAVLEPLYRGTARRADGDLDAADREFAAALAAAEPHRADNPLLEVFVLGTMHRRDEAAAIVEPLVAAGQLPPDVAANLLVRLHRYAKALEIITAAGPPPSDRPWEAPARHAEALLGVGEAARAVEVGRSAVDAFENHLARLSRDVLRTMAADDNTIARLYTTVVRAHAALASDGTPAAAHLAGAFELSDRCRGTALVGTDGDRPDGARRGPAARAAVREWRRSGAALARTVEALAGADPGVDRIPVRRVIATAERVLDDAEAEVARLAPELLGQRLPGTPPLDEVQRRLDGDTVVLQQHAFDDELIIVALTRDTARLVRHAAPTPALTAAVRRYHRSLAERRAPDAAAASLAGLLLDPFAAELDHHRRVVVVPHGALTVLPVHVLPVGGEPLGLHHVVSYLPVASLVRGTRAVAGLRPDAPAVIVGDPEYGPARGLPQLPGARVEAGAVAKLWQQAALLGPAADRATVLDRAATATVLHLATHGTLHEGAPYSAELALAGDDSLTVPDLVGLDTDVDLAVLSACDSGRGRATAAGDLIGLTRALLTAGVRELVVSLWPVDDRVACLTMIATHRELVAGASPADALATAQRSVRAMSPGEIDELYRSLSNDPGPGAAATALRRSTRHLGEPDGDDGDLPGHPYYWAPFVHIGG